MTVQYDTEISYYPYDDELFADPYPVYRRLRDEAPLYHNEQEDFYVVSRADDVQRGLVDREAFSNSKSDLFEYIRAGLEIPPGMFIWEDPPKHTKHRALLSRVFTPRRIAEIEPKIRALCARTVDALAERDTFDFAREIAFPIPMRVIGMILGIPEDEQQFIREAGATANPETGEAPPDHERLDGHLFADFVDWREQHPADDLMTDLLHVEFEDETGLTRRLRRDEILTFVNLLNGAGSETTWMLIGWAGKILADHPDQRRELAGDLSLVPDAVEEILRYEPPLHAQARWVAHDAEFHGLTVPEGSVLVCISGSANRDERRFPDPDTFDIHRRPTGLLTFGYGTHFCLGAALARMEVRVTLEELLKRIPDWTVDAEHATFSPPSPIRGWTELLVGVEQ